ncbi:DUF397 domain-containing protein [Streptosporangium sp. NPDC049248]|uniref:DUF397 domain-containing protein n=1 Tax=Streptosporangium sp. NPDC049248 TaxID=3155651 RepID=UPI00342BF269
MSALDLSRVTWRKNSRSWNSSDCVEVGVWRKSSLCGAGQNCVEVDLADTLQSEAEPAPGTDQLVLVRDSKDPGGPVLAFTSAEWDTFIAGIKGGSLADLTV